MKLNLNVDVRHLTRVEGHGNIKIRVVNGIIKEASWKIVETPRFFEVMFKNLHYSAAGLLAARICGICSISHCLCSIRATENAFNVTIPKAAEQLRLLAKHGETLQSHFLHILFLVLPDYLNEPDVFRLHETKPEIMGMALRLKGLANRLCETIAGRTTHPVSFQVGGVTKVPPKRTLLSLRDELHKSFNDLYCIADLYATFRVPDFIRETEFVSLKGENDYPFVGGLVVSSDGIEKKACEYQLMTNEYVDKNNTAKWAKLSRPSYAVGALARYNNNHAFLHPAAAKVAIKLGLKPPCHNPFMNTMAQLVECFHVASDAICLLEDLIETGPGQTMARVTPGPGEGISAMEAPRGILFHHYTYDKTSRLKQADCVVPTSQNNANIHLDINSLVKTMARTKEMTDEKLERLATLLVRSYDPCISCSVH